MIFFDDVTQSEFDPLEEPTDALPILRPNSISSRGPLSLEVMGPHELKVYAFGERLALASKNQNRRAKEKGYSARTD